MLHLKVVAGDDRALTLETSSRIVRIGRDPKCELQLTPKWVSRFHGKLTQRDSQLIYTDTNSRNGSRIVRSNGRRLEIGPLFPELSLEAGDFIVLGDTKILVVDCEGSSRIDSTGSSLSVSSQLGTIGIQGQRQEPLVLEDDLLQSFLHLRDVNFGDEHQVLVSLSTKIAQAFPHADGVAVVTLKEEVVGRQSIKREDLDQIELIPEWLSESPFGVSVEVLSKVIREDTAVCFTDNTTLPTTESTSELRMSSCAAAPIAGDRGTIGFIQLFTQHGRSRPFKRRDLGSLAVFAGMSSLLLRQSRALKRETQLKTQAFVGQVVTGMSHDAKNVLKSLGDYAITVEDEFPGLVDSDRWRRLQNHFRFLRFLVQEAWARIEADGQPLETVATPLRGLCNEVMELVEQICLQRSDRGWLTFDNGIPSDTVVETDPKLLTRTLFNGLKNAVEAYRPGDEEERANHASVQLRTRSTTVDEIEFIDLAIIDDAGGIAEEVLEKLGREFTTTKGSEGSGIGTHNMLECMTRLGGRLIIASSCESNDGPPAGTCLTLRIPVKSDQEVDVDERSSILYEGDYAAYRREICPSDHQS